MRIQIDKSKLLHPLAQVEKVASAKNAIPILDGVLLSVGDEGAKLVGGNSDMFVQVKIPQGEFQADGQGAAVIPAGKFLDIVKSMPEGIITLDITSGAVTIHSGKTKIKLSTWEADMYPELPNVIGAVKVGIETKPFLDLINLTTFAVSNAPEKPTLHGVKIEIREGQICFTAANSIVMSIVKDAISSQSEALTIVSGKNLNTIAKLIGEEETTIFFHPSWFIASSGAVTAFSRIIEGPYPPTERLYSFTEKTVVTMSTTEFRTALHRSTITTDKTNAVKLSFSGSGAKISSKGEDGETEDYFSLFSIRGPFLTVIVDGKMLTELLGAIENDEMRIRILDAQSPMVMSGDDEETSIFVIVPRLK